jgi:hypothetical protein
LQTSSKRLKKNEIKKLENELKYPEELNNTSTYKEATSLKQNCVLVLFFCLHISISLCVFNIDFKLRTGVSNFLHRYDFVVSIFDKMSLSQITIRFKGIIKSTSFPNSQIYGRFIG